MDGFTTGPAAMDDGFIFDEVRPPQDSNLGFLGAPRPAPFQGEPVEVLRGNERVFGPTTSIEAGVIAAVMPRAGDVSAMAGQAVGAEEHDPRNVVAQDGTELGIPTGEAAFAARVQQCWPKAMETFIDMMSDPDSFGGASRGVDNG